MNLGTRPFLNRFERELGRESSAAQGSKAFNARFIAGKWIYRCGKAVKRIAGKLLIELGYADSDSW